MQNLKLFKVFLKINDCYVANDYPAVTSYINEMRTQGKSDEDIKENLLKIGWDEETVEELLKK